MYIIYFHSLCKLLFIMVSIDMQILNQNSKVNFLILILQKSLQLHWSKYIQRLNLPCHGKILNEWLAGSHNEGITIVNVKMLVSYKFIIRDIIQPPKPDFWWKVLNLNQCNCNGFWRIKIKKLTWLFWLIICIIFFWFVECWEKY